MRLGINVKFSRLNSLCLLILNASYSSFQRVDLIHTVGPNERCSCVGGGVVLTRTGLEELEYSTFSSRTWIFLSFSDIFFGIQSTLV